MKAECDDLKNNFGEIRLFPESIDDLWHLQHLVSPGDLVFATTFRSVDTASDKLRPEKMEKRPVRLGIRIERGEFSEHGVRLRLSGVIEHGIEIGAYHTINVETGFEISVIKQWRPHELERIERAVKSLPSRPAAAKVRRLSHGPGSSIRCSRISPISPDR